MSWLKVVGERPREPPHAKQFSRLARTLAPPVLKFSHRLINCCIAEFCVLKKSRDMNRVVSLSQV